ncbi:MAG: hypothetical protein WCX06_00490 [Candidatus Paceibacterota bacterium]
MPIVLVATPNYEERSIGFSQWFLHTCHSQKIDPAKIFAQFLWPQGTSSRVDLLEKLKISQIDKLSEQLQYCAWTRSVFSYPDDFNERQVIDLIHEATNKFSDEPFSLIIDISCMPRRVIVSVCDAVVEKIRCVDKAVRPLVFFVYASPKKYAAMRYAQNIGNVKGYFSGRPIHNCPSDHVTALIFASLQGYEGKVLYDEVRSRIRSSVTTFVAVSGADYQTSLATMRANQFLMEQRDIDVSYYFSLMDGMEKLAKRIEAEGLVGGGSGLSRMVLVAPFGPKVFTLGAYFMLSNLRSVNDSIQTEIAHVSGFQYLSLYSLGLSHFNVFKLCVEI